MEFTLTDTFSGNKKDFWKLIRHFTRSKNSTASIPPLCSILPSGEKTYHVTDADKANCLNNYFISISSVDDTNATLPLFYEKSNKVLDKMETTEKEVQDIFDSLNLNKASGPDLISHKMIKKTFLLQFRGLCVFFLIVFCKSVTFLMIGKIQMLYHFRKKGMQIYQQITALYHYLVVLVK